MLASPARRSWRLLPTWQGRWAPGSTPLPPRCLVLSTTPALPWVDPTPGLCGHDPSQDCTASLKARNIHFSSLFLSNKPSILILLIIGEQIFPQIIRQLKSYTLPLRTIFNPDLNVIYTSQLPEAVLEAKTWIKYFLNVKCCLIVDCAEFIGTDMCLVSCFLLLPE